MSDLMSINWKKKKFLPNTFQNPYHPAFTCVKESNQYLYQSIYTTQIATSRFTHADVANTQLWKMHDCGFLSGRGGSGQLWSRARKESWQRQEGVDQPAATSCAVDEEVSLPRWPQHAETAGNKCDCWGPQCECACVWVCTCVSVHVCALHLCGSGGERLLKSSVDKGR